MTAPLIRMIDVRRDYRLGGVTVSALRGATLEINAGEFVAVMGPSGSGKSTLMNIIGLLDRPTAGISMLDGKDSTELSSDARARLRSEKIGFIFQNYNLLARNTALKNVALPLVYTRCRRRERIRRAEEALAFVGLADRRNHFPNQLSGGEQQRVAIARALVNAPSLLLADEPTGALDSATGDEIMELLLSMNCTGRTIVLVTHAAEVAQHAHRIIRMRDGRTEDDAAARGAEARLGNSRNVSFKKPMEQDPSRLN